MRITLEELGSGDFMLSGLYLTKPAAPAPNQDVSERGTLITAKQQQNSLYYHESLYSPIHTCTLFGDITSTIFTSSAFRYAQQYIQTTNKQ